MVIPVEEGNRGIFFEPGSTITKFLGQIIPYYSWSYTQSIPYFFEENEF